MLKAVIFDFDYTLGDSTNGIAASINYALEVMGHGVRPIDEIKKTVGHHLTVAYTMLTGIENQEEGAEFARLFIVKANEVMVANTTMYEGSKECLQALQGQGIKTAIVTTKNHGRIEDILKKFEASELVELIVGGDDVKCAKPSPEGLLWAMEHLGVEAEEVLYVGDSIVDAKTAEAAGVEFAAVLTGTTTREEFAEFECKAVCEDISELHKELI